MELIRKLVDRSKPYTPHYARFNGKRRFFKTEAELDEAIAAFRRDKPAALLSKREAEEWRRCRELLPPGTSMLHVVSSWLGENKAAHASVTVKEALQAFREECERNLSLRPAYQQSLRRFYLRVEESEFFDLRLKRVTPEQIEAWCKACGGAYVQHEVRGKASTFFTFCKRRRWLEGNPADADLIALDRLPKSAPGFLSLPDVQALVNACAETKIGRRLRAALMLQLFLGIRSAEVCRLDWAQVKVGEYVDIQANVSKTHERRVIDWWPENLTACLGDSVMDEGPIVKVPSSFSDRKSYLIDLVGIKFPRNAMRHTYATYGVAKFQDAAKLALLLGHRRSDMIFKHYRAYASQAEGEAYFKIVPR